MKKILIIDDEPNFCYFLKKNLKAAGEFEVNTCCDSSEAVARAKKFKPDLVLLDILMPRVSGSQIAETLKNDKETCGIPIIFITAVITPHEVSENGNVIAGRYFIAKPIEIKELVASINKFV